MNNKENSSYKQIMKATSLFGGVQVFTIIISIIRSKFIAVLLGPEGMGIAGLLTATSGLVGSITGCGLGLSSVKNIAAANNSGNSLRISIIIRIVKRLVWLTGLIGTILMIVFSKWLSILTFGNDQYSLAFIWISITILFNQLSAGQMAILQGLRKLQYMAKASLSGSLLGLIITVPLYYILGIDGIVPAIIIGSIITLVRSWYFSRKVTTDPVRVSTLRTYAEGKNMIFMGIMISLSGLISTAAAYVLRIFINDQGGVDQVGLYNAGFAIVNTYVGMIFTAMGTDYYPRLSAIASDNDKCRSTMNQQSEIAILILAPIIMIFLVFINWVVIILYSSKFIPINEMIHWAALGMFFKSTNWAVGMILLAKGSSKIFFWNELIANIITLLLNLIGYRLLGLTGLGISFLVAYALITIQTYLIARIKFNFSFSKDVIKVFLIQSLLASSCMLIVNFLENLIAYILGSILVIISAIYSIFELDKRMGLRTTLLEIKAKYSKK